MTHHDPKALHALAVLVETIRPDWPANSVATLLRSPVFAAQPLAHLAAAAVDAACTPSTTTPAGIAARLRNDWIGSGTEKKPLEGSVSPPFCPRCRLHYTDGQHHERSCEPVAGQPVPMPVWVRSAWVETLRTAGTPKVVCFCSALEVSNPDCPIHQKRAERELAASESDQPRRAKAEEAEPAQSR